EDPEADRVVDVVVDVRDPVDQPDDRALESLRLSVTRMREDPVPHLAGEVQLLGDPQRLLVVAEAQAEAPPERLVERLLPGVAERSGELGHGLSVPRPTAVAAAPAPRFGRPQRRGADPSPTPTLPGVEAGIVKLPQRRRPRCHARVPKA